MEPLTTKDLALLNASLLKLYSFQDASTFPSDLVRLLPTLIPADICSYDAIDAQSQQADLQWTPDDVVMIPDGFSILAKHVDDNPIVPHFRKTGDGSARMASDFLSQRTFRARPLYQEFYKHYGISFHLITALSISGQTTLTLAYHRGKKEFGERDRRILNGFRPHVLQALQTAHSLSALRQEAATRQVAFASLHLPVLCASANGRILWITPSCESLLRKYGRPIHRSSLSPDLLRWIHSRVVPLNEVGEVRQPVQPLAITGPSGTLVVRGCECASDLILMFKEKAAFFPLSALIRLGLTQRESEILSWVAQGKTNPEIGTILGISPRMVQKHLERVYSRLGVENRHAAMALVHEALQHERDAR